MAELTTLGPPVPTSATPAVRAVPAALVSAALMGVSALAYVFTVLAARALVPHAYGELAALLGVALVGIVPATGLQTAAALYLGGHRGDAAPVVRRLHATALVAAVCVAIVGAAATAPIVALLHLPDPAAVGWLLLLLVAHTVVGGYEGMLQGTRRYARMAVVTTCFGVAKLVGGTAGLLLGGTPTTALAGMALGAFLGALAGWLGAGRPGLARGIGAPGRAALRASGALLGFVLLLNLDVLLARHHLPGRQAGEYAVAAVFAKVAFWLPQGVGVVLLPRLADAGSRTRAVARAIAVVTVLGAGLTAVAALLGGRAVSLVGGSAYGPGLGGVVWLFALLGTLLAVAQLLLYSGIAAADRRSVVAVWTAAVAECVVVEALAATGRLSGLSIAGTATLAAAVLVTTGLVRLSRGGGGSAGRRPRPPR
ncbi:polysaccharide biosynthesis protein [Blastococcus sp. CT_GayMR16]|uniref:polysaccharide biosynthesis protein n=1 Tax=Blastococcus sp. CT_GayMR16 TaxID=2559607 RepID=UPI0010740882|nr:polysaccharide biosynthesis protein [Blastococcus sp. CT_GayMR16]TFV85608.1 polysaccharide biosynthesis protein [Blastococcus sp. CT_GayMR16]